MTIYDLIYEEINDRYENGELTLEQANEVNDLAYERYIIESSDLFFLGISLIGLIHLLADWKITKVREKQIAKLYTKYEFHKYLDEYEDKNKECEPVNKLDKKVVSKKELFNLLKKIDSDNESFSNQYRYYDNGIVNSIKHHLVDYPDESTFEIWLNKNKTPIIVFLYNKKDFKSFLSNDNSKSLPEYSYFPGTKDAAFYDIDYYNYIFCINHFGLNRIEEHINGSDVYKNKIMTSVYDKKELKKKINDSKHKKTNRK